MKLGNVILQLSGIDLASLKESEIIEKIKAQCVEQGYDTEQVENVNVYINIEGTAVTAYYICDACNGAIKLN
ncbi:hypothetical protein QE109_16295 [Fusibacter bizertensis]|uniref:DUF4318 domain-containing protein n=1 Tax=Fusibacter bizertensis TaxID=1488331 RepID=A0ABT6NHA0_9FIRM|nr:DUF6465 family protein [Fusibacter bizertensis]MDH8679720.1 hypothetical protein [Fusibacter bizertensis]